MNRPLIGAACILANLLAWLGLRHYGFSGYERVQTLALIDTLIAVLWYTELTHRVLENDNQRLATQSQPVVVIEFIHVQAPHTNAPTGWRYVARNIGPGLALNVAMVFDLEAKPADITHVGALGPGDFIELPTKVIDRLTVESRDGWFERKRHVVVAERIDSAEWTVTENLVEIGGRVTHRVQFKPLPESIIAKIHKQTANEYVTQNWPAIQADLEKMFPEDTGADAGRK